MCHSGRRCIELIDQPSQLGFRVQAQFKVGCLFSLEETENVKRRLLFELLVHDESPPSCSRNARSPRRMRAFTVPKGAPSRCEICVCVNPEKKARSIAWRWPSLSWARAA